MGFFTDAYDLFVIGIVVSLLKTQWVLSTNQVSWLNSATLLASAFGAIIFGRIADMLGRKRIYGYEVLILAAGDGEPRRLVDLAAQVEHGQAGDGAEAEQQPPGEVAAHARAQEDRGDQRAHHQAGALHGEHQPDHLAPGLLARVLAHDRGRDRVVAADPDAEDHAADEQHYIVRREGRGDRTDRRRQQRGGVQPRHLGCRQVPLGFQQ